MGVLIGTKLRIIIVTRALVVRSQTQNSFALVRDRETHPALERVSTFPV